MMFTFDHFGGYPSARPQPRLLSPSGWYLLSAVIAISVGGLLGLVI